MQLEILLYMFFHRLNEIVMTDLMNGLARLNIDFKYCTMHLTFDSTSKNLTFC